MYTLNLEAILSNPKICGVIKYAGMVVKNQTYYSLGDFLQQLSDIDLDLLKTLSENMHHDESAINLIALTEMMSFGEGITITDFKESEENLKYMAVLLALEDMKRRNQVTLDYSKIAFQTDIHSFLEKI